MNPAPTLFDLEVVPSFRADGPDSSRDAALSLTGGVLRAQQWEVFELVALKGTATAYEVAQLSGIQQNVVAKRMTELRGEPNGEPLCPVLLERVYGEDGKPLTRSGRSGRGSVVHRLTPLGKEWLAGTVTVKTGDRL